MTISKVASKRLGKEYLAMQKSPPPFVWARPNEANVLEWHYILRGPPDSPYSGTLALYLSGLADHSGEYWGTLLFPADYPFAPPTIKMNTPSGRFVPSTAICTSMSSFHPSTWNPAWSVNTILVGLLSFMLGDEITTGSVRTTDAEKEALAKNSHAWNIQQPRFKLHFSDYSSSELRDLPVMGSTGPAPPPPAQTPSTPVHPSSSTTIVEGVKADHQQQDQKGVDSDRSSSLATAIDRNEAAAAVAVAAADTAKRGSWARSRRWFVWAFVVLLVSWGGMKVLE